MFSPIVITQTRVIECIAIIEVKLLIEEDKELIKTLNAKLAMLYKLKK